MHDLRTGEHCFPELAATQFSGTTQRLASPGKKMLNNSPRKGVPPPPSAVTARKPLGEMRPGQVNRKVPQKVGKVNGKAISGARPVLRDIMYEVVGEDMEN